MKLQWYDYFKPYKLKTAGRKTNSIQLFCYFLVMGFMFYYSLNAKFEGTSLLKNSWEYKINKLQTNINTLENENNIIESEVILLNEKLNKLFQEKEPPEIVSLSKYTGTHKYVGNGVSIKIYDAPVNSYTEENPNIGIVHNTDLLKIINDLWSANAEAISVNNQRISMNTEILCIGPTIMINKKRIASPFVINVVGQQDKLCNAINNGHLKKLTMTGIKFNIQKKDMIEISSGVTMLMTGGK